MANVNALVQKYSHRLNSPSAPSEVELMIREILKCSKEELILNREVSLDPQQLNQLEEWVDRRSRGEPMAYILGYKFFFDHKFYVESGVLIPRPETEHLVEEALIWLASLNQKEIQIFDFGCGSGCIGLSIIHKVLNARLTAIDQSPKALEVTKINASALLLDQRLRCLQADLSSDGFQPPGVADLVVANPPYIAQGDLGVEDDVKKFEPSEALFSGSTGLECIESWKESAWKSLRPGGLLVMEFGYQQGSEVRQIFIDDPRFKGVTIKKDLDQNDRYLVTTKV